MSPQIPLILALFTAVVACDRDPPALTPPGGPEDFLRAADVLSAAQCELDAAATRSDPRFSAMKAEITLTLTVQVSESSGGSLTLTIPIATTDLTLRRDRVPEGAALRLMDFRITHIVGTTPACPTAEVPLSETGVRYIEGGLGLREWVTETDRLVAHTGRAPREVNYAMSFNVTLRNDRSPIFSRAINSVDADFVRQEASGRETRHRIVVTIIPGQPRESVLHDAANRFLDRIDN
ncbi:hypothetical protein [Sulfitobacter sediminilitoris]|uniref:hypothetical protein n=1 Tax=Sulfitobacter sediminilitoris TaxID=2698830 RepID=UPI003622BE6F